MEKSAHLIFLFGVLSRFRDVLCVDAGAAQIIHTVDVGIAVIGRFFGGVPERAS